MGSRFLSQKQPADYGGIQRNLLLKVTSPTLRGNSSHFYVTPRSLQIGRDFQYLRLSYIRNNCSIFLFVFHCNVSISPVNKQTLNNNRTSRKSFLAQAKLRNSKSILSNDPSSRKGRRHRSLVQYCHLSNYLTLRCFSVLISTEHVYVYARVCTCVCLYVYTYVCII